MNMNMNLNMNMNVKGWRKLRTTSRSWCVFYPYHHHSPGQEYCPLLLLYHGYDLHLHLHLHCRHHHHWSKVHPLQQILVLGLTKRRMLQPTSRKQTKPIFIQTIFVRTRAKLLSTSTTRMLFFGLFFFWLYSWSNAWHSANLSTIFIHHTWILSLLRTLISHSILCTFALFSLFSMVHYVVVHFHLCNIYGAIKFTRNVITKPIPTKLFFVLHETEIYDQIQLFVLLVMRILKVNGPLYSCKFPFQL